MLKRSTNMTKYLLDNLIYQKWHTMRENDWKNLNLTRTPAFTQQEIMELKERDTAKAPVDIDDEFDMYVCPSCNMAIGAMGNREEHHFCLNCGQRLKWEG